MYNWSRGKTNSSLHTTVALAAVSTTDQKIHISGNYSRGLIDDLVDIIMKAGDAFDTVEVNMDKRHIITNNNHGATFTIAFEPPREQNYNADGNGLDELHKLLSEIKLEK